MFNFFKKSCNNLVEDYDINKYLLKCSKVKDLEIKEVKCNSCGNNIFNLTLEPDEGAIEVECTECKISKLLLDSEDIWEEIEPYEFECQNCNSKAHKVKVGLSRRSSGEVNWVYIGTKCTSCQKVDIPVDWKIDYGPTDKMEKNI